MNGAPNPVPAQLANHVETVTVNFACDRAPDIARAVTNSRRAQSRAKGFFGALFQLRGNSWRGRHGNTDRRVGVESILASGDVELYKVAGMKRAIAWNSMHHFIVDADTIHAWKSIHKPGGGLRAVLIKISPADGVEFRRGHTGTHFARYSIQCSSNDSPDRLHFRQLILSGNGHPATSMRPSF